MSQAADPLYRRIGNEILRRMTDGELPPGARLAPEVELARQFGVSRQTMRAALGALVREGRLERKPGRGTVVVEPKIEQRLQRFYRIEHVILARGLTLSVRVLARGRLHADDELADQACKHLELARAQEIGYLLRLRLADGIPVLLENITFPVQLCPSLLEEPDSAAHDSGIDSFYDAVAASSGLRVTRAHEVFRPVALAGYEARLLAVPSGAAAFQVERTSYSDMRPIEWRHTLARGDQFTFAVDLHNPLDDGELS